MHWSWTMKGEWCLLPFGRSRRRARFWDGTEPLFVGPKHRSASPSSLADAPNCFREVSNILTLPCIAAVQPSRLLNMPVCVGDGGDFGLLKRQRRERDLLSLSSLVPALHGPLLWG